MKSNRFAALSLLLVLRVTPALAQMGALRLQSQMEAALRGKDLPLRDFPGEDSIRFSWQAGRLNLAPERCHTPGVLRITSMKIKVDHGKPELIKLTGERRIVLRTIDPGGYEFSKVFEPVTIEIDLRGAGDETFDKLPALLFFEDVPAMLEAIPSQWRRDVPALSDPDADPEVSLAGTWIREDAALPEDEAWRRVRARDASLRAPILLYSPTPQYSKDARKNHVEGVVRVEDVIGADGSIGEIWLLRPVGFGLDSMAVAAVNAYRFDPARYAERAVATQVAIDIHFKML